MKSKLIATVKENYKLKNELTKVQKQYSTEIPKLNKIISELKLKCDNELGRIKEKKQYERIEKLSFAYKELYQKTKEIIHN